MKNKNQDIFFYLFVFCAFLTYWNFVFFSFPQIAKADLVLTQQYTDPYLYSVPISSQTYPDDGFDLKIHTPEADIKICDIEFTIKVQVGNPASSSADLFFVEGGTIGSGDVLATSSRSDLIPPDDELDLVPFSFSPCVNLTADTDYQFILKIYSDQTYWDFDALLSSRDLPDTYTTGQKYQGDWREIPYSTYCAGESNGCNWIFNAYDDHFDQPEVYGITPASGSEVPDINSNLKIGYQNLNFDEIDGLIVSFENDITKTNSGLNVVLDEEILNPVGWGQIEFNLNNFDIDTQGIWNLRAFGFTHYFTGEGLVFHQIATDNYVLDPYFLNITDSSLKIPFTFQDPATWYAENSEYATSTAFFTDITGIIAPVFEKVGNFAFGIQNAFNTDESYQTGYNFGAVLPAINGYIKTIDAFFGGFPLATIFKYIIYVLIAIFVIRLIFKFIPFFG